MKKTLRTGVDFLYIAAGNFLYALAVLYFIKPHAIPLGGVAGVSLVLNHLWLLPIGLMTILLNAPLFLLSYRVMGRVFIVRTLFSVVFSSVLIDLLENRLPEFHAQDDLLAAIYGGVLMGLGLGIVFARGATTGGTDIVSKLIQRKHGHLSLGRITLAINFVVIVFSAAAFQNAEAVLYALIVQFVSATAMDSFLNGLDKATVAFIVTTAPEAVSEVIFEQVKRGSTAIPATGMFTGSSKTILLCAVRRHEMTNLKKSVVAVDPECFMILTDAQEVLGHRFKHFISQ